MVRAIRSTRLLGLKASIGQDLVSPEEAGMDRSRSSSSSVAAAEDGAAEDADGAGLVDPSGSPSLFPGSSPAAAAAAPC